MAEALDLEGLTARVRALQAQRSAPVAAHQHAAWLTSSLDGTWRILAPGADGQAWGGRIKGQPLVVIWSVALEDDGQTWLHVSATAGPRRATRTPTYDEMAEVKRLFCGDHRPALSVWPRASEHVNLHPHALHVWAPFDATTWPLPPFDAHTGSI
jgi:hypothetical protein